MLFHEYLKDTVHGSCLIPDLVDAPDDTLMMGIVPFPPGTTEPGVPPTFPGEVGECGTIGRAGEETGVV